MTLTPAPLTPTEAAEEIQRLQRRVEREREARRAAEAIAEKGMRDLYHQQRRLQLVETIATASNLGDDPAGAFRLALEQICDFTGWQVGHVYMFPDGCYDADLISAGIWHGGEGPGFAAFREASAASHFTRGVGLPGRVMATGKAEWIEDINDDGNFPRARAALACGLHGAFAFPALVGTEVGAVLEFFSPNPAPPDAELLRTLDQIGAQLGRVVERYRNAARLREDNAKLAALYGEAETQRRAAEAASRAKSAFLAVTSHEIRTPLNAVLGLAEALKREALSPRQHELNDGVLESGAMLLRLLNAVLDLSKIEAGRATARMEDFDLADTLDSVASIWSARADELGVTLALDRSMLGAARIRSDKGRIEQTLVNLVSNALKFTPRGGAVRIRAAGHGEGVGIEVTDGGSGVPEAERNRIFEPFEQTAEGREAGGAGLGLAICKGNVQVLGGRIGADQDAAGRSRFWFSFPVESAAPAVADPGRAAAKARAGTLRVLAAEDNPTNRRVLQVLLEIADVDLTFAENGQEALDVLADARFDLVLMDVNMPVMDGVEALRRIRARPDQAALTPVVMLTANAFADDIARYEAAGADGVLTKPIQLPELYATLDAVRRAIDAGAPASAGAPGAAAGAAA